jgi:hypothetical protein
LGHGKRYLPAIQIFIAVLLIPILTHLSSRWTVPLKIENFNNNADTGNESYITDNKCIRTHAVGYNDFDLFSPNGAQTFDG